MNKPTVIVILFLSALLVTAPPLFAGDGATISPSSLLALVRHNYNPETTIESKIKISLYWSVREKEERKQGTLLLAPDDRFRLAIGEETFVSNGKTVWTFNGKADQVVIKDLADVDPALRPARLFTTYIDSCPFREKERTGGVAVFSWSDGSASAAYTTIRLWVRTGTGIIDKCVLTDRNKNVFTYTFTGTVFGKRAPLEAFDFVIPKGARVVDSRKK